MKTSGTTHKPKQAISNIRGTPNAYDTVSVFENGAYQTYVVTHCIECGEETRIHWNTGGADPAFVDKKMRGLGWRFDVYKPKNCVCPECVKGRKQRTDDANEASLAAREDDNIERVATPGVWADVAAMLVTPEEPMAKSSNSYTPPNTTDTAVLRAAQAGQSADDALEHRRLTAHEKARIRALLDSHFDDAVGRYIDNYDDQRVGRETNLPWACVAEYRELAYGPLKADPAVEAFQKELAIMQEELKALSNAIDAMRARFEAYSGRLVNLEAKAKRL